ncbi:MAG: LacI family DNA-binding transcriptional regulator [Victivallaceae bacterium]
MRRSITIRQIAEMAGVNASTVSRVFNPDCGHSISDHIKSKVMSIANKYEYAPKSSARSLAHGKSFKLGVILGALEQDMSSPTFSLVFGEFCREAMRHGYQAVMLPAGPGDIDQEVLKNIRSSNADGYWIGASMIGSATMLELERRQLPVAAYVSDSYLKHALPGVSVVHADNTAAFAEMLQTVKTRGFERFIEIIPSWGKKCSRRDFYLNSSKYGLIAEDFIEYDCSTSNFAIRHEAATVAMENIERLKKHDLIICHNDLIALGVCDALRSAGIKPGEDISIIGYDNIEENPNYIVAEKPFICTISKNDVAAGKQIVQKLLDMINTKQDASDINIPAHFICRDSLGFGKKVKEVMV